MWWLSSASLLQGTASGRVRHTHISTDSKDLTICIVTLTSCIHTHLKILLMHYQRYVGIMEGNCNEAVSWFKYAKGITFQYFFGTERALKKLKAL